MRLTVLAVGLLLVASLFLVGCGALRKDEAQFGDRYSVEHQAYLPVDHPYWQEKSEAEAE